MLYLKSMQVLKVVIYITLTPDLMCYGLPTCIYLVFYFFYFAFLIAPDVGNYGICLYIGLYAIFSPYPAKLIYLTFNRLRSTT